MVLKKAVAGFHRQKDLEEANVDCVPAGPGSKELMFLLQLVFYGDIIVPTPSWVSYVPARVKEVASIEEARAQTQVGVALVAWCGSIECCHELEDRLEANMLGEPQYITFPEAACAVCRKRSAGRTCMARQY